MTGFDIEALKDALLIRGPEDRVVKRVGKCPACFSATNVGDAAAGKEKAAQCTQCHGLTGNSDNAQFPRLAGQHASYLVRALEDYKTGARQNPIMAGFAAALSEQDREDLAAWYASQDEGLYTIEFTK